MYNAFAIVDSETRDTTISLIVKYLITELQGSPPISSLDITGGSVDFQRFDWVYRAVFKCPKCSELSISMRSSALAISR